MSANPQGIGSTGFFFVPEGSSNDLPHGNYYYSIRVYLARVILTGGWWSNVTSVALATSATASGDAAFSASGKSLNQAVRVNQGIRNTTISCGKNIVDLVPAAMDKLNLQVQLVATRCDPVADFFKLVQSEAFSTALSFAPGPLSVLKTLSGIVPGLIKVFEGETPPSEPALDANHDYTVASVPTPIQPGYLVVLSAMGENSELNQSLTDQMFSVTPTDVLLNGKPIVQACYVVFKVGVQQYRGIGGRSSQWVALWEKTTTQLNDVISNVVVDPAERKTAIETAYKAIFAVSEMQVEDYTYTKKEMAIYRQSLADLFVKARNAAPPRIAVRSLSLPKSFHDARARQALKTYPMDLAESLHLQSRFELKS